MPIALASQFTQRNYSWTSWKIVQNSKSLIYQYDDDGIIYTIYGYDGPEVHLCTIFKNIVPYSIIDSGYSQIQNDLDKIDFENNFLIEANKEIEARGILIDRSGFTSATPNTSTQVMTINLDRKYLFIQNVDNSTIWINFTSQANLGSGSIELISGASFVMEAAAITTEAMYVISGTASVPYTAKEK